MIYIVIGTAWIIPAGRTADLYVPSEYVTIQAGIDAATDGDTVWIADGTYTGSGNTPIDPKGKIITIRSENGPDQCIVDCQGSDRAVYLHFQETDGTVIQGISFLNGSGEDGGLVRVTNQSALHMVNCVISGGTASASGGGIYCFTGTIRLVDCQITGNTSSAKGGAIYAESPSVHLVSTVVSGNTAGTDGGAIWCLGDLRLTDSTIQSNECPSCRTGGVSVTGNSAITGCVFQSNTAASLGGALKHNGGVLEITSTEFNLNHCNSSGGALSAYDSASLIDCRFTSNSSNYKGGALYFSGTSLKLADCGFTQNESISDGAAAYITGGNCVITRGLFDGNTASNRGGGLFMMALDAAEIRFTHFHGNTARDGAAVYSDGTSLSVTHCILETNAALNATGSTLCVDGSADPCTAALENVLVWGNTGTCAETCGVITGTGSATLTLANCTLGSNVLDAGAYDAAAMTLADGAQATGIDSIFWNGTPQEILTAGSDLPEMTYSDIQNGYPGEGNSDADPFFVAGPEGNGYLSDPSSGGMAKSPCIDAGSDDASAICFTVPGSPETCLSEWSTRTDGTADILRVDLGFHRPAASFPEPTPTPEDTPVPTLPPTPTATVDPTATPEPSELGVDLDLNLPEFCPGDEFVLTARIGNPGPDPLQQQPMVIVLDAYGTYFWYPDWTGDFNFQPMDTAPGIAEMILLNFTWPETPSSGAGILIYGALLTRDFSSILGEWDQVQFSWNPGGN